MPRPRKPARLYLRKGRGDRRATWVILAGAKEFSTGAGADERGKAEAALEAYLAQQHRPPRGANQPSELLVSEVMAAYLREHAPTKTSAAWIADMAADILRWWGDKALSEINGRTCRAYVDWRTAQSIATSKQRDARAVTVATARHELTVLRAAIRYFHREHGPLVSVPAMTLPPQNPPRDDYFWTRDEAAKRLRAARRRPETHHIVRLILIGLYSGTRPGAMMKLRWLPSTDGGWIDLDNEIIHRRAHGSARTKKRQPPARIHKRLLAHLRKWRDDDMAHRITSVIHYAGEPVNYPYRRWNSVRKEARAQRKDAPHILRHTAATWFMSSGADVALIAGYLGMSIITLMSVYGHHHPSFQEAIAQGSPRKRMNQKRTG
jgi:hypothetical protein